jgi:UDP-glucose 4-epimerase
MRKIVIFGATGNIGAYFTDYCNKKIDHDKYEIIATGRKKTNFFEELGVKYVNIDLQNDEDFKKLPTEDVYAIVNLAGVLPAYLKEYNPFTYIDVNIKGSLRILEYARKTGVDRVIYTQTWAEMAGYWGSEEVLSTKLPRKLLYTGDHAFYAITKCMVVDTMEYYKQEFGIKNFVFRLPNVYLYNPTTSYFVDGVETVIPYRYMIERASRGDDIEMWGNPDAFKDMLYVKDLCKMMYLSLFVDKEGGTYNAGTGIKTTLREQIEGMIEVFSPIGKKSKIIEVPEGSTFTSFVMDIENLRTDLGYEPEYTYIKYLEDYKRERESDRFGGLWR